MVQSAAVARASCSKRCSRSASAEKPRQDLDRDVAFEARVAGAIDLAHAACAQKANHFIRPKLGSRGQRHEWGQLYTAMLETGLCPNIASLGASRHFAGRAGADVFCVCRVRNRAKLFVGKIARQVPCVP